MTLSQQLREAGEKATPGAWAYRPDKYDDWGVVKSAPTPTEHFPEGIRCVLAQVRDNRFLDEEVLNAHRRAGTDPWQANARLIVLLRNNLDTIIAALEAQEADGDGSA
jgi:hypothetical protein